MGLVFFVMTSLSRTEFKLKERKLFVVDSKEVMNKKIALVFDSGFTMVWKCELIFSSNI